MKTLFSVAAGFLSLSLLSVDARSCGDGATTTITGLSNAPALQYQVNGMNAAGQLTGYYLGQGGQAHAFLSGSGGLSDLGTLGGSLSQASALNASGQVAGDSFVANDTALHGFLFDRTNLLDLGTLGGPYSSAVALNDSGVTVGISLPLSGGSLQGFVFSNHTILPIGTLGGSYSSPFAINNAGVTVGESSITNEDIHAFVLSSGIMTDLGTLGGNYSSAFAINASGQIAGESSISNGNTHTFFYSAGTMHDLATLGGTFSSAGRVNSNGMVSGNSFTSGDAAQHGFVYASGLVTDLQTLGGSNSIAHDLNNLGQVVGESDINNQVRHAFMWQNNTITDLNTLLPAGSGWELTSAQFINDNGRIVGFGTNNGAGQWFILDPGTGTTNQPPVAVAGPDQIVDCHGAVTLDASQSSDPDRDGLSFQWTLGGTVLGTNAVLKTNLAGGTNTVNLKVTDPCGASSQDTVMVIVAASTPPVVTSAKANPDVLWPPNHKLVTVNVCVLVTGGCDSSAKSRIISITANEKTKPGDIQITGDLTAKLAASRNPGGKGRGYTGRVYTINVVTTDASGNSTLSHVEVKVPLSQGKHQGHDDKAKDNSSKGKDHADKGHGDPHDNDSTGKKH